MDKRAGVEYREQPPLPHWCGATGYWKKFWDAYFYTISARNYPRGHLPGTVADGKIVTLPHLKEAR